MPVRRERHDAWGDQLRTYVLVQGGVRVFHRGFLEAATDCDTAWAPRRVRRTTHGLVEAKKVPKKRSKRGVAVRKGVKKVGKKGKGLLLLGATRDVFFALRAMAQATDEEEVASKDRPGVATRG